MLHSADEIAPFKDKSPPPQWPLSVCLCDCARLVAPQLIVLFKVIMVYVFVFISSLFPFAPRLLFSFTFQVFKVTLLFSSLSLLAHLPITIKKALYTKIISAYSLNTQYQIWFNCLWGGLPFTFSCSLFPISRWQQCYKIPNGPIVRRAGHSCLSCA